jgi:hypothetical protein
LTSENNNPAITNTRRLRSAYAEQRLGQQPAPEQMRISHNAGFEQSIIYGRSKLASESVMVQMLDFALPPM